MKANQILSALNLPTGSYNTKHASKLAGIYAFLKEIKEQIISAVVTHEAHPLFFGRHTEKEYKRNVWTTNVKNKGKEVRSNIIRVTTKTGDYSFAVPVHNDFYIAVCSLLGISHVPKEAITGKAIESIAVSSAILKSIGRAAKFVSEDALRPAMQQVCITFENGTAAVAATNAYWLYLSPKFESTYQGERFQVLLGVESAGKVSKIVASGERVAIDILPGDQVSIAGSVFDRFMAHYPQYECVVPEYSQYLSFDRVLFASTVKAVLPCANPSTNMVNFHVNGVINVNACDIDFNYESTREIPYVQKTIPDMDISFNGKMLLKTLANFKDKQLKMYSAGQSQSAAIISNDTESVLLMPILNC